MFKHAEYDEWYWLREIYRLLRWEAQPNILLDWIVPIATTLLAAAAIYLAYQSYQTAKRANDQAKEFRDQDRAEADLRWRRTFAVDLRDWYLKAHIEALFDVDGEESSSQFRGLIRKCDKHGEAVGKRLSRWLAADLRRLRAETKAMTPQQQAKQRHPSRLFARANDPLIDNWIADPERIIKFLDEEDAKASAAVAAAVIEVADESTPRAAAQ